ncbi:MAG: sigma-70 family RNA polymerase sigma factor [Polyangiaceae bacterium]
MSAEPSSSRATRDPAPLTGFSSLHDHVPDEDSVVDAELDPTELRWGDARRVAQLVGEHSRFLWRLLRRFGVAEDQLDDATQQVFIVAARKLDLVSSGRERPFLCGIAVRIASNRRRATVRLQLHHVDATLDDLQSRSPTAESLFEEKQARTALDLILSRMPEDLRAVFVLCELEGLTAPETASIVGAPVGTVSSRLRRARSFFREVAESLRSRFDSGHFRQGGTP